MLLYPAFLDLRGALAVVVGGGPVALRKVEGLLGAGAQVSVIAPTVHPDLAALNVGMQRRAFVPEDVRGARVVVAATDSDAVNDAVAAAARAAGAFVNHASRPERGDLRLGAGLRRGPVQISVSTGAELPMLAQALRDRLDAALPAELPLEDWAARRRAALDLPGEAREAAMQDLRADIRRVLGVGA